MAKGLLNIIGCGIKFMSHLTVEAKTSILLADKLFYLVNEPAMKEWLLSCNPNAKSLDTAYHQYEFRADTYKAITHSILNALEQHRNVCIVLEGHPFVFAQPALDAAKKAREKGCNVNVVPGISAEDYLFAELLIDPGACGCQSYEATDFLIYRRLFDNRSHLILWQISVIGMLSNNIHHDSQKGAKILVDYLSDHYALNHEVTLYEGSQYPHIASKIQKFPLMELPNISISRISTLYVPPIYKAIPDLEMIKKLGINLLNKNEKIN